MKRVPPAISLNLAVLVLIGVVAFSCFTLLLFSADTAPMPLKLVISSSLLIVSGLVSCLVVLRHRGTFARQQMMFAFLYGVILTVVMLMGIEFLSSFYAPSWPARALRSVPVSNPVAGAAEPLATQPWSSKRYNGWGMFDAERTVVKPMGGAPRIGFVGDSFVESAFTLAPLPAVVEHQAAASGFKIEAINLGVSATGPRSYYYRIRDVALKLSPDAILLFIYAGNDFVPANERYSAWPSLIDESSGGAVLGAIMPRTNWLLVNRFKLSELLHGNPSPPGETEMMYDDLHAPPSERIGRLVAHVKKYYYPELSEEKIGDVLSRGDGRLWRAAEESSGEQEYLMGWMLDSLVSWETGSFEVAKSPQDAVRLAGEGEVHATFSWIEAADRLAHDHHVPLVVFLAPVGTVDPAYAEFWKPWPRAYSWNYICDERQSRLAAALGKTSIRFVDLRADLTGIPGTYRRLDGHWSKKGEEIVANRVEKELEQLFGSEERFNSNP